jgi:signal transduction histidine kinase
VRSDLSSRSSARSGRFLRKSKTISCGSGRKRSTTPSSTRAETVLVQLAFDAESVRLSVQDDGRGFDPRHRDNSSAGHFGLVGMRERADEMGGDLTIKSGAGQGTEVSVTVPI